VTRFAKQFPTGDDSGILWTKKTPDFRQGLGGLGGTC